MYNYKQHHKRGMTIIEMLIAIGIFSIISLGIVVLFGALWRLQGFAFHMGTSSQQASHVVIRVTDLIRNAQQADNGAYLILSASPDEFIFFTNADSDSDVERVRLFRDGVTIKKGIINPSGLPIIYNEIHEIVSVIARDVVNNDSGSGMFNYYNEENNILSSIIISDIRMIEVNITVDTDIYNPPEPTLIMSFSSLRNLRNW